MANITFNATLLIYLIATLGYTIYLVDRKPIVKSISFFSLGLGLLSHTITICLRSMETGHGPDENDPVDAYPTIEDLSRCHYDVAGTMATGAVWSHQEFHRCRDPIHRHALDYGGRKRWAGTFGSICGCGVSGNIFSARLC